MILVSFMRRRAIHVEGFDDVAGALARVHDLKDNNASRLVRLSLDEEAACVGRHPSGRVR